MVNTPILPPEIAKQLKKAADKVQSATGQPWEIMRNRYGLSVVPAAEYCPDGFPDALKKSYPRGAVVHDTSYPMPPIITGVLNPAYYPEFEHGGRSLRVMWSL
jgi:hypothetical protein